MFHLTSFHYVLRVARENRAGRAGTFMHAYRHACTLLLLQVHIALRYMNTHAQVWPIMHIDTKNSWALLMHSPPHCWSLS